MFFEWTVLCFLQEILARNCIHPWREQKGTFIGPCSRVLPSAFFKKLKSSRSNQKIFGQAFCLSYAMLLYFLTVRLLFKCYVNDLAGALVWVSSRGPFWPQPFCDFLLWPSVQLCHSLSDLVMNSNDLCLVSSYDSVRIKAYQGNFQTA